MNRLYIICFALFTFIFSNSIAQNNADSSETELFKLSLEELLDIKVSSASRFEESAKEIPYSTYIITKEDINTYGYRDLAEALQHVPGFTLFDDHTQYKENFGVRGLHRDEWNQGIVFLVNGIRQRSDYDYNNKLSYINVPIQSIEKIEVIKGPASVTYGNGAFFGVVNIITTNAEDPKSDVYAIAGSQSTYGSGINYRATVEDFNVTVNTGFKTTKGIEQNYNDITGDTSLSTLGFMDEQQKYFAFNIEKNGFYAGASIDRNSNNRPSVSAPYISDEYEGYSDFTANRYAIGLNKKISNHFWINSSYEYQFQEEELFFDFAGLDNYQEYQNSKIESSQLNIDLKYQFNPNLSLTVGGGIVAITDYSDVLDVPLAGLENVAKELKDPAFNWWSYARLKYKLSKKFALQAGLRIDQMLDYTVFARYNLGDPANFRVNEQIYPNYGLAYIPEFSFFYSINNKHQLKLIYGEAINRPSMFRVRQASEGAKPENIKSLELNYNSLIGQKLKLNSSIVYNYLFNLVNIEFSISNGSQLQEAKNSGVITSLGFETEVEYRFTKNFRVTAFVNAYETKNHNYSEYPEFSPQLISGLNVAYQINQFTFALTNIYVSETESKYNHQLVNPNDINSPEIGRVGDTAPAYLNTGLNLRWRPNFVRGLFANLRISNLFNQKMYTPVNEFNPWASKGTLGISRTYLLTLGYEF